MGHPIRIRAATACALIAVTTMANASVTKDLPYPSGGNLTADQIIEQTYFVNHFYAFKNYAIVKKGRKITVLLNKVKGKKPTATSLERYLNNEYNDGVIKARDMAIFRSGKLKGTGMLVTDYVDDNKSQSYMIWLPALRKIRRFAQPAHDDAWGGSDFTFGDVVLRKPFHETHELLGKETFGDCLGFMKIADNEQTRYTRNVPKQGSCSPKGKEVYKVKSTTKFKNWWYDYRISYIDTRTFADYRTEYFKDGNKIKVIDRDWVPLGKGDDPRAVGWGYWYGTTLATGHETWAVIPSEVNQVNAKYKKDWWSEKTLRKLKR
ncbi:outer membrane lipoprotein-sorting protein [endosymbiont of unidentified scaly snail isolate Monju]|uniref:outer membrane lipoprotein-sorting protein n=1 Tax=endosymbiont of unidentified scaly snail isolate Monju TaxID=1248727 RepID=UPI00038921D4|nr:outer membrane lipoprotein-sorting protein [endosymbiont of unidentified scaly snail isolate Monju]BAN68153.1 hypothetical protein EBS_0167 [endosymbiont of unidentified scaly snail isolate Monju]